MDVDESLTDEERADPAQAVKKLAERKGHAAVEELLDEDYRGNMAVIASDTMVVLGSTIFGKPRDEADARQMIEQLSGRTHQVFTAVSLWLVHAGEGDDFGIMYRTFTDVSSVTFKELSSETIEAYLQTDEPYDKAGAYGIQGEASSFVEQLDGSLDTVIGLPVERLIREFPELFA